MSAVRGTHVSDKINIMYNKRILYIYIYMCRRYIILVCILMLYMLWTRNRSHVRYATCEENKNQYRIPLMRSMNRLFREKETDDIHTDIILYVLYTQDVGPAG